LKNSRVKERATELDATFDALEREMVAVAANQTDRADQCREELGADEGRRR
jgi:hypothetical protein